MSVIATSLAASGEKPLPAQDGAGFIKRAVKQIWHINGSIDLPPGQSPDEALDRLQPLLKTTGTNHERAGDALVFIKRDPASQDKLAAFNSGVLQIANVPGGPTLRYALVSRSLLACFLAPLMFLGFSQGMLYTKNLEKEKGEAAEKLEKAKEAKDAKAGVKAKKKPPKPEIVLNPIDKALGAPAPKTRKEMAKERAERKKEPIKATPAFVFAGIFAALYLIGRWLEARLAKNLFRKALFAD